MTWTRKICIKEKEKIIENEKKNDKKNENLNCKYAKYMIAATEFVFLCTRVCMSLLWCSDGRFLGENEKNEWAQQQVGAASSRRFF